MGAADRGEGLLAVFGSVAEAGEDAAESVAPGKTLDIDGRLRLTTLDEEAMGGRSRSRSDPDMSLAALLRPRFSALFARYATVGAS